MYFGSFGQNKATKCCRNIAKRDRKKVISAKIVPFCRKRKFLSVEKQIFAENIMAVAETEIFG